MRESKITVLLKKAAAHSLSINEPHIPSGTQSLPSCTPLVYVLLTWLETILPWTLINLNQINSFLQSQIWKIAKMSILWIEFLSGYNSRSKMIVPDTQ